MLTRLYGLRIDAAKSVRETHAILKAEHHEAYTKKCKTAQQDDEDLTKANWMNIQRFQSNWIKKMNERGNTLRKPGGGRPATELSAACKKIVEKNALVKGGSEKKVRAALAAKGYKISRSKLFREMRKILDWAHPIKMFRLFPRMMESRMQFADFWTNLENYGKLTVNDQVGINRSATFLAKVWNWLFTDEKTFYTFGSNTKIPPRWVTKGRQYTVQTCKVTQKSFHVWGGICGHGNTKLYIFEDIMDANKKSISWRSAACLPCVTYTRVPTRTST